MRRFSQRSALVTLSEINITPLLDLAFVLLIIFVITTPLLEQSINLKLPKGGTPDRPRDKRDIRTVEISLKGVYYYNKQSMPLAEMEANLIKDAQANPNLVVDIRADEQGRWKDVAAVMDCCQRHGIKIAARTEPPGKK
ncbi:MAG TPA: biopolymer transporter ExbD [Patescibacteria group bacterium]|nr:biopolymer transporter ExbD [Patescibacteria group bacterium]